MLYIDLNGRINNIRLRKSKALLPIFEAIVNSIQSIEDLKDKSNSYIKVIIERDTSQKSIQDADGSLYSIENVIIEDNGIGFNDDNFKSFLTSDSMYKQAKGGKGIGRLLWLIAFEKVDIKSTYEKDGCYYDRDFIFSLEGKHIEIIYEGPSKRNRLYTSVKLINYKEIYKSSHPKKLDTIAIKVIEHCISYFILKDYPDIIIDDGFTSISLNMLFKEKINVNTEKERFSLKGNDFDITHVKLYLSDDPRNRLHYCANDREVFNINLAKLIPNMEKRISVEGDMPFIYSAYLSGKFLDNNVNLERTNFNIWENDDNFFNEDIKMNDINNLAVKKIKNYLGKYLEPIIIAKEERIRTYIGTKSPQYKPILKYKNEELDEISPYISDAELELELFKISQKMNLEFKKEGEKLLNKKADDIKDLEQYKKEYSKYVEHANDIGKSSLAQYIIHRKVILDLFENSLRINDKLKYSLEEYIHRLVFPMKAESDDIDYEKHNLWLIDEKLSYHYYLASDIPFKKMGIIDSLSEDRPDILIIDNPVVVINEDTKPYNSIVIFEFKRPMRSAYNDYNDNPISQVYNYVKEIRRGAKCDKNGRPITVQPNTAFYLYIICDVKNKIIEIAENYNLTKTPDGLGFFGYNTNINSYIEIISYDKLIDDAIKRNTILFQKLFKPQI